MKGIVTGDPNDRYTQDDVVEYISSVNKLLQEAAEDLVQGLQENCL